MVWVFLAALLVPLFAGYCFLRIYSILPGLPVALSSGLVLVLVSVGLVVWMLLRFIRSYHNCLLGYKGERAVGEHLNLLHGEACRVFHDMPAQVGRKKFNLDHIVVGPTGVWLIETKPRRKGRARPGYKDHQVTYTGKVLDYPWGEEAFGLEQARYEAQWLSDFIFERTGMRLPVKAVLALPGWFVVQKGRGDVFVLSPKTLPGLIRTAREELEAGTVDLISRQLDLVCRVAD